MLSGILVGTLLLGTGCNVLTFAADTQETNIVVEKDRAKQLDVQLELGAGEMTVTAGADDWVDGVITFNHDNLEPKVSYRLSGDTGKLKINQPDKQINMGNIKNKWDLKLSDNVPVALQVESGASETNLNLQGLQLEELDVNAGVGNITINLNDNWKESFKANIDAGVGNVTLILPEDVGVKITTEKGIGSMDFKGFISEGNGVYVNKAYETADVVITIDANMGVGNLTFQLAN
ncbi:hypothetical protein EJF36_15085 [Bacillus sp. HMF5848]|nr:hypothetical protein EJF36_15085 [Bacillus sp. HMF5848]